MSDYIAARNDRERIAAVRAHLLRAISLFPPRLLTDTKRRRALALAEAATPVFPAGHADAASRLARRGTAVLALVELEVVLVPQLVVWLGQTTKLAHKLLADEDNLEGAALQRRLAPLSAFAEAARALDACSMALTGRINLPYKRALLAAAGAVQDEEVPALMALEAAQKGVAWGTRGNLPFLGNPLSGPFGYPEELAFDCGVPVSLDFQMLGLVWADAAVQHAVDALAACNPEPTPYSAEMARAIMAGLEDKVAKLLLPPYPGHAKIDSPAVQRGVWQVLASVQQLCNHCGGSVQSECPMLTRMLQSMLRKRNMEALNPALAPTAARAALAGSPFMPHPHPHPAPPAAAAAQPAAPGAAAQPAAPSAAPQRAQPAAPAAAAQAASQPAAPAPAGSAVQSAAATTAPQPPSASQPAGSTAALPPAAPTAAVQPTAATVPSRPVSAAPATQPAAPAPRGSAVQPTVAAAPPPPAAPSAAAQPEVPARSPALASAPLHQPALSQPAASAPQASAAGESAGASGAASSGRPSAGLAGGLQTVRGLMASAATAAGGALGAWWPRGAQHAAAGPAADVGAAGGGSEPDRALPPAAPGAPAAAAAAACPDAAAAAAAAAALPGGGSSAAGGGLAAAAATPVPVDGGEDGAEQGDDSGDEGDGAQGGAAGPEAGGAAGAAAAAAKRRRKKKNKKSKKQAGALAGAAAGGPGAACAVAALMAALCVEQPDCCVCLEELAERSTGLLTCTLVGGAGPFHAVCNTCWAGLADPKCPLCMAVDVEALSPREYLDRLAAAPRPRALA